MFDAKWFNKYQKTLLWFANSWIGKKILGIKEEKIAKITPNSIHWIIKKRGYYFVNGEKEFYIQVKAIFYPYPKFAKRLYYTFYPLGIIAHLWDKLIAPFNPVWDLGFNTFTSSTFLGGAGRMTYTNVPTFAGWHDDTTANGGPFATYEIYCDKEGATFNGERVYLPIDTSSIGAGATVTGVTLNYNSYVTSGSVTECFTQTAQATLSSLATSEWGNKGAGTNGGTNTTSNASPATAKSIVGSASTYSWINITGNSKLGLREYNFDILNTAPTAASGISVIDSPQLVVTYTFPAGGGNLPLMGMG